MQRILEKKPKQPRTGVVLDGSVILKCVMNFKRNCENLSIMCWPVMTVRVTHVSVHFPSVDGRMGRNMLFGNWPCLAIVYNSTGKRA